MAKIKRWTFKKVDPEITQRPLRRITYPPAVGWVGDILHKNPDIRSKMWGADSSPEDIDRMLGEYDRSANANLAPSFNERYHSNPMILTIRAIPFFWAGKGNLAGKSKSMPCRRCGKNVKPNQMHEVEDFDNPDNPSNIAYEHNTDYGDCKEWNTEGRPWGAKRWKL